MGRPQNQTWLPVIIVAVLITVITCLVLYYRTFRLAESEIMDWTDQIALQWKHSELSPGSERAEYLHKRGVWFQIIRHDAEGNTRPQFPPHPSIRTDDIRAALQGTEGTSSYYVDGEHLLAFYRPLNEQDVAVVTSSLAAMDRYYLALFSTLLLINAFIVGFILLLYHHVIASRRIWENDQRLLNTLSWDHVTGIALLLGRKQTILESSPGVTQRFGLAPGDLLQHRLPDGEKNEITALLQEALDHQIPVDFECSLQENNGETSRWSVRVRPWHQSGRQYLVLTGEDISKRLQTEAELNREQERVNAYFNAMQTVLITCDTEGRIVRMNKPAQTLLQMDEQQIQQQPFEHLLTRPGLEVFRECWQSLPDNLQSGPGQSTSATFSVLATSGRESILRWQLTRLSGANNSDESVLLAGLDITDEVANREALEKANARIRDALEEAETANRSKSIFLASMSHEIRTPMNGILGAAELLLDSGMSEDQKQYLQIIHGSSHVLLDIINDILDLSKIESGKLEIEKISYDLNDLLTNLYQLFKEPARKKGLSLVYFYDGELPQYWLGDPKRTRQIITNLLSNALKFTDDGCIELRAEGKVLAGKRYEVSISVRDQGIGIPAEKQAQIFEAFRQADTTTSRQYGGTGLGLTISQYLAQAMGGDLKVTSVMGEGSTFSLTVPLNQAEAPRPERRKSQSALPGLSGHILLAEDNLVNQKITIKMLDRLGIQVSVADNGEEAIGAVMEGNFDLVLMDVNMPVMDGIEATERIRDLSSSKSSIPIIALTANAMLQDKKRCLEAGMNGFIAKPLRMDELASTLREALAQRRQDVNTSP